jgi:hypothetical protein
MNPSTNRPTVATLLTAFLVSALTAAQTFIPPWVPPELVATGYTLLIALIGIGVGKAAQGQFLGRWLGETAPWSAEAHARAVAEAAGQDVTVVLTDTDDA